MSVKVLVVDDDFITGGLTKELLSEAGLDAELLTYSKEVLPALQKKRYDVAILDILMPGIDGLTLLHKIKTDPQFKYLKVIMVSSKSFPSDKQRARLYGADHYIVKPYNVETFAQQVLEVANRKDSGPAAPAPAAEFSSAADPAFQVAIWGCRSLATGPTADSRYGKRTSCVSVEHGERLIVFDAGSGLAELGSEIERQGRHKEIWLFLTHFHRDHTEGLGAFSCAQKREYTLHITAAAEPGRSLQEMVQEAFEFSATRPIEAQIRLYEVLEESYEIFPGTLLTSFYANHPGLTLGYSLQARGRKLVYCPDSEIFGDSATALQDYDERLGRLVSGADLLLHDGRYTIEDYRTMQNNGHSSFASAVMLAAKNRIKRLALFHLDSQYSDEHLDRMAIEAAKLAEPAGPDFQCALAREGLRVGV